MMHCRQRKQVLHSLSAGFSIKKSIRGAFKGKCFFGNYRLENLDLMTVEKQTLNAAEFAEAPLIGCVVGFAAMWQWPVQWHPHWTHTQEKLFWLVCWSTLKTSPEPQLQTSTFFFLLFLPHSSLFLLFFFSMETFLLKYQLHFTFVFCYEGNKEVMNSFSLWKQLHYFEKQSTSFNYLCVKVWGKFIHILAEVFFSLSRN